MSEHNPSKTLPLFAAVERLPAAPPQAQRLSPSEHGEAGRDDAVQGVGGGIPEAIRASARHTILAQASDFTTDTLAGRFTHAVREVLQHAHHRNALAGLLTMLSRSGEIRFTGSYVKSVRPEARGRMLKVWAVTR